MTSSTSKGAPLRIVFAGTPDFAASSLQALVDSPHTIVGVYTQPDRRAGRGRKLSPSPVKQLALEHALSVYQPENFKNLEDQDQLRALEPDLMVVAAYGLILPQSVLDIPEFGCINVHASLLPRWRGAAPIQRAIAAGDTETGITIMQMEAGLDTGPMLYKLPCPIETDDTGSSLHDKLADLGGQALATVVEDLAAYIAKAEKQDDALATYAAKLEKQEALIDWSQPASEIEKSIRAYNSWPVAYTRLGSVEKPDESITLRIWQAEVAAPNTEEPQADNNPGTLLSANRDGLLVSTGEGGALRLQTLQWPGSRPMPASDLLNARAAALQPGIRFE